MSLDLGCYLTRVRKEAASDGLVGFALATSPICPNQPLGALGDVFSNLTFPLVLLRSAAAVRRSMPRHPALLFRQPVSASQNSKTGSTNQTIVLVTARPMADEFRRHVRLDKAQRLRKTVLTEHSTVQSLAKDRTLTWKPLEGEGIIKLN